MYIIYIFEYVEENMFVLEKNIIFYIDMYYLYFMFIIKCCVKNIFLVFNENFV